MLGSSAEILVQPEIVADPEIDQAIQKGMVIGVAPATEPPMPKLERVSFTEKYEISLRITIISMCVFCFLPVSILVSRGLYMDDHF